MRGIKKYLIPPSCPFMERGAGKLRYFGEQLQKTEGKKWSQPLATFIYSYVC
jgi:hypothetical protein